MCSRTILALIVTGVLAETAHSQCLVDSVRAEFQFFGFGNALEIDGDWAFIGEPFAYGDIGQIRVYRRGPGGWSPSQLLTPPDGIFDSYFGTSIAVSESRLITGAYWDPHDAQGAGSAYVFDRVDSHWFFGQKLTASDANDHDYFGVDVALSGDTALVGASWRGQSEGAVYVFERTPSGWVETQILTASDASPTSYFGHALTLAGDVAVIASAATANGPFGTGAAYVFDRSPTGWTESAQLLPDDPSAGARFGAKVTLADDIIVVSAYHDETVAPESGAIYVFEKASGTWSQTAKLKSPAPYQYEELGRALAWSDGQIIAGAGGQSLGGFLSAPDPVYVFERVAGNWVMTSRFVSPTSDGGFDAFGFPLTVDSGTLMATDTSGADTVHFVALGGFVESFCVSTATSLGHPAELSLASCASTVDSPLEIVAAPTPTTNGFFMYSASKGQSPLGDGFLCLGSPIVRLAPQASTGTLRLAAPVGPGSPFVAGSTWRFQAAFRDPASGATGWNLSDGLDVTFAP